MSRSSSKNNSSDKKEQTLRSVKPPDEDELSANKSRCKKNTERKKPKQNKPCPPDEPILDVLLKDLIQTRTEVRKLLQYSPEELSVHRVHAMYVDRILDVLKAQQQRRAVDRERLLLESLQTVVDFLIEKGEPDCAQVLGNHLEDIGNKVKRFWNQSDNHPVWREGMPASGPESREPSLPSPTPHRKKKNVDAPRP